VVNAFFFDFSLFFNNRYEDLITPELEKPQEIVEKVRTGDKEAFERLFHHFQPGLYRFLWRMVRSEDIADDLLQNIFLKLWKNRETWRPGASISGYLYRAAKNSALNHLRDKKLGAQRFVRYEEHDADSDESHTTVEQKELSEAIQKCIDALPQGCRTVFILSRYEAMTYREIAGTLEISAKTVDNHMGRALRLLRDCLREFI
jgi:RNA polymerase sigma-70 factor (ECF subfamily)